MRVCSIYMFIASLPDDSSEADSAGLPVELRRFWEGAMGTWQGW